MEDLKVYTGEEVCEMLKISRRTLYRCIKDESIKGFKAGGNYRFTEEQVKDFIASGSTDKPKKAKKKDGTKAKAKTKTKATE